MDKLNEALEQYYIVFKENYPLVITDTKSDEEIIARIHNCIINNTKEKEPEYKDNCDY